MGFKVIKFFKIIIQKLGEKIQRGKIIFETNATTFKANLNLKMNMYKYLGLIRVDNVLIWIQEIYSHSIIQMLFSYYSIFLTFDMS